MKGLNLVIERGNNNFTHDDGVTLKEFVLDKVSNLRELMIDKIVAADKAVELARLAVEKRLESMNEFRETLREQAMNFITRNELEIKMEVLEKSRRDNLALYISLVAVLISISTMVIRAIK